MKTFLDCTDDEKKKILNESRKRSIFYTMYYKVFRLRQWFSSIYRPDISMDKTHAMTVAYSILNSANELAECAQKMIDILEDDTDE